MRLIITGNPAHFERAMDVASGELSSLARYSRVGWGWQLRSREYPAAEFFVRRIKSGLSVTITDITPSPPASA